MRFDLNKEVFSNVSGKKIKNAKIIAEACNEIARSNLDAMIIIESMGSIKAIESGGVKLEADLSKELLVNIFNYEKPSQKVPPREQSSTIALSDGAVVIRNNKISRVACSINLPDIDKRDLRKKAVELSRRYGALVIICEKRIGKTLNYDVYGNEIPQRGIISVINDGEIEENLELDTLVGKISGKSKIAISDVERLMLGIRGLFTKNVIFKLLSFFAAFILWAVVININNPMETYSFSTNVIFEGTDTLAGKNLVWMNEASLQDLKVNFKVRGKRLALEQLKNASDKIKAVVSLQMGTYNSTVGETNKVLVNITLPNISGETFEITERSPQYLDITLEKYETLQKDINLNLTGEPKNGFVIEDMQISPNVVQVSGPASVIATVSEVKVTANISGISKDLNIIAGPKAYDIYGNEVLGVDLSVDKVNVNVPINEYKKIEIDASANQGMLEEDYILTDIVWEPKYVEIVGKSDIISRLDKLELPAVDLTGINENKEIICNIMDYLPDGVSLKDGYSEEIIVKVSVAKEEVRDFRIPIRNITVQGFTSTSQQYKLTQEYVWITIKAIDSIMENLDADSIKGNIRIGSYSEGEHSVPIEFNLPNGAEIVGRTPTVSISISEEKPSTEEPTTEESTEKDVPVISTEVESTTEESTEEETEEESTEEENTEEESTEEESTEEKKNKK